jgi:hypothetical protein
MILDLARGESTRVERQDLVIEALQPSLPLFHELRLDTAVAVAGHRNVALPRLGVHRLLARAIPAMVPIALLAHMRSVASVFGQLYREGALDHPFRQPPCSPRISLGSV